MWTESLAKRGTDEIASILYKYFKQNLLGKNRKLVVYTDKTKIGQLFIYGSS